MYSTPLDFIPRKQFPRRRRRHDVVSSPPTPAALTLTAADASISDDKSQVTLTFDRDVDVSAMNVTAIRVGTISTGNLYQGDGVPSVFGGQIVEIDLVAIDTYPETNVKLFADADNGIVAVDDGGTWVGTGGTTLPFP